MSRLVAARILAVEAVAAADGRTFERKSDAPAVQDLVGLSTGGSQKYWVRVNGKAVKFTKGIGAPVKPDDTTGVCCAYVPVLEALNAAGAAVEFVHEPKRIPANKKWLRALPDSVWNSKQGGGFPKRGGREMV